MPMGGQAGTSFEVTITGENIDEANELLFSHPKITAKPKVSECGKAEANTFVVTIAADAPQGVHEARVLSRLGISSSRAFSVSGLPEVTRVKPNTSLETALELKPNSICNAVMTPRGVDFYAFQAAKGKRLVVECAARGIDSKLNPVLIIADAKGRDLLVDRRGGLLDFKAPADGKYFIKVHDLTFQGGPAHFYRLALLEEPGTGPAPRQPSTTTVSSFSWVPDEASKLPRVAETEPNNQHAQAQKITPPCEIEGRFYPAADVDTFEFTAKKGDVWWVEVASERLGLPTDPFVVVQRVTRDGSEEKLDDVAEFNDIPSPIKPSSNGYSYDGPVYDAGSADALGKLEIKEDGVYRLQLRDLFGGTRSEAAPRLPADHSQAGSRFRPGRVGPSHEPEERRSQRALQTDRAPRRGDDGVRGRGRAARRVRRRDRAGDVRPARGRVGLRLEDSGRQVRGDVADQRRGKRPPFARQREDFRPRSDRRENGDAARPSRFDGLAGEGCEPGDPESATGGRRAGVGQPVGGCARHDRTGREQGLGGQGRRQAHDPAQGHLEERVHGRLDQAERPWDQTSGASRRSTFRSRRPARRSCSTWRP